MENRHVSNHEYYAGVLRLISRELESLRIPYLLAYGTELGARRHGGFIPHDDDIDLCIRGEDMPRVREIAARLKVPSMYSHLPWGPGCGLQKLLFPGALDIDLFSCRFHGLSGPQRKVLSEGLLDPDPPRVKFCGLSLPVNRSEAFLDIEYGPQWRDTVIMPGCPKPLTLREYNLRHADFRQPDLARFEKTVTCLVNGAFDMLHSGHVNLFARAKVMFGKVIALVDSDRQVMTYKKRKVRQNQKTRMCNVAALHWVDQVVASTSVRFSPTCRVEFGGSPEYALTYMDSIGADIILCGDENGYADCNFQTLLNAGRVYTTPRTPGISSSQIELLPG